jgi:hypothetical protein
MKINLIYFIPLLLFGCVAPSEFDDFGTTRSRSYSELTFTQQALLPTDPIPKLISEPQIKQRYNQVTESHELNFKIGTINRPKNWDVTFDWDYEIKNGKITETFNVIQSTIYLKEVLPLPTFLAIGGEEKKYGVAYNLSNEKKIEYDGMLRLAIAKANGDSKLRISKIENVASYPSTYNFMSGVARLEARHNFEREIMEEDFKIKRRDVTSVVYRIPVSDYSATFTQAMFNWFKQNQNKDVLTINAISEYETIEYRINRSHIETLVKTIDEAKSKSENN